MRLIILAAGQGFKLDGINKLLIRNPQTGQTLLHGFLNLFKDHKITVVTGFKAIAIMSLFPELDFVHNPHWRTSGNSYSLSLALNHEPCIVISADLVFNKEMVHLIQNAPDNSMVVYNPENKKLNTVRCKEENGKVKELYVGEDFESSVSTGIFKITDPNLLQEWKKRCFSNRNTFAALNLPLGNIHVVNKRDLFFHDINTPLDYLNLIKANKNENSNNNNWSPTGSSTRF
jgi:choline kinase